MIECWNCHKIMPRSTFAEEDGYCPCCGMPVDFDEDDDDD